MRRGDKGIVEICGRRAGRPVARAGSGARLYARYYFTRKRCPQRESVGNYRVSVPVNPRLVKKYFRSGDDAQQSRGSAVPRAYVCAVRTVTILLAIPFAGSDQTTGGTAVLLIDISNIHALARTVDRRCNRVTAREAFLP